MVRAAQNMLLSAWRWRSATDRSRGLSFWMPIAWLLFVFFCAVTAEWWPVPPLDQVDWTQQATLPGNGHYLGTDSVGRDILSRLLTGLRISLIIGILAAVIGLLLGGGLGLLAGFYRGRVETVIVGSMDTILAFPGLVLLLAVTYLVGASLVNITLVLGCLTMPAFCRVARANTLRFAQHEFVLAARAAGAGDCSLILRELLPNVIVPLAVYALLVVAYLIVIEGSLGFLGLSVPAPTPSLGGMIADGRGVLEEAPHVSLIPMAVLFLTILSFNLLGDRLRSLTDVRESQL